MSESSDLNLGDLKSYRAPRRLRTVGIAALAVAGGLVAWGLMTRVHANQQVATWTQQAMVPDVKVFDLANMSTGGDLVLPATIQAFYDAPIHARVPGYLKKWYADIGTRVKAGQVLADIDTPDLDQQLAQAQADLATAQANEQLSDVTAKRWNSLLTRNAVSRQETDEKNGDLAAKRSLVNAAQANVERLKALESFKHIVAPFAGVVTTRSTDIGALIVVGGVTDVPLFSVADESQLRIYVNVPQSYTAQIRPGMMASFTVPEHPGEVFHAPLKASADAVNTQSGTLLLQLQIDNSDGKLKPGDYAQVQFDLPAQAGVLQVPATALTFRNTGMAVAVVGPHDRAIIKPVQVGRDFGATVQVNSGLSPTDKIIDNPPDSLETGDLVRVTGTAVAPQVAHG
ncbi:MAG TPA: efflux RND transporter periplasmic adaptor subunit [Caulobacteraceae bacterium]|jgi:RND family efflux transporter MFP subunit|nr:efflux RND transporter periplasmic adaptor subunit [Caulobacteraceae bacterium]